DGFLDAPEQCDDGNTQPKDGCDPACRIEPLVQEIEPNDDGATSPGGGEGGNDFSAANAQGPFARDALIAGAIEPAGDEDIYAIANLTAAPVPVLIDTFDPAVGVDPDGGISAPCGPAVDTTLNLRDSSGAALRLSTDRSPQDLCSEI